MAVTDDADQILGLGLRQTVSENRRVERETSGQQTERLAENAFEGRDLEQGLKPRSLLAGVAARLKVVPCYKASSAAFFCLL
jgi:hypothetical protein